MSKIKPLISIIVPTYKRNKLLKKSLQSLINQTYENIEIVVVNNYPQEPIKKIIKQFNDKRIKLFREKVLGSASARNMGLVKAKGKYICFCDDDDLYLPEKVEKQFQFMNKNHQFDFSYHNFYFQKKGRKILSRPSIKPTTTPKFLATNYLTAPIHTLMIKKKCLNKIRFDPDLPGSEDSDFVKNIVCHYQFGYFNKPLVIYSLHSKNKKNQRSVNTYLTNNQVSVNYLKKILKTKIDNRQLKTGLQTKLYYHKSLVYFFQFRFKKARLEFFKFIKEKPFCFWPYLYLVFSLMPKKIVEKKVIPNITKIEFQFLKLKSCFKK
jgi:glycosyltransferase involved in cell wall biosynthesis